MDQTTIPPHDLMGSAPSPPIFPTSNFHAPTTVAKATMTSQYGSTPPPHVGQSTTGTPNFLNIYTVFQKIAPFFILAITKSNVDRF